MRLSDTVHLRGPGVSKDVKKLLDETLSRTKLFVILGKTIVALPGRKASDERTVVLKA